MLIFKGILILLGIAFTIFGYLIFFRKKFYLINGFEADFKLGKKDELYAKKVGLIEFSIGIFLLIFGIVLIIFS